MLEILIKKLKEHKLLVIIVLLAFFLRFYKITDTPPSLNWDEVSHGYNAYSILKTGKDEWGKVLPVIFRAYGDYKLPIYIYLVAISQILFGLSAFAVRLPSILAGTGTVALIYFLVLELFSKNNPKPFAALAALLVAIEPWSLFLSRGAFEANLALFLITAGVYFFLKSIHTPYYLLLSTFFFGLSVWAYNSARVFVPIFLIFLIYTHRKEIREKLKVSKTIILASLFIILLFFLPMFVQLADPSGQARYGKVAIIDDGAVGTIIEARNNSQLSPTLTRILYNRPTYFVKEFLINWASHYTGDFLVFKGGSHYQFSIPEHGLIYLVNLPFLVVGIVLLLKRRDRPAFILLAWFYFGSFASALTREAPHTLRSITMLPAPMAITAYGLIETGGWIRKKRMAGGKWTTRMLLIVYCTVLAFGLVKYLKNYFRDYRKSYSWSWQYGYQQVVDYTKENYEKYDKIIVTKKYGEPHEFFLFYWPWNPADYQNDPNLIRFEQSGWYWVDRFDKYYFVNDWDIPGEDNQPFTLESGSEIVCEFIPEDILRRVEMGKHDACLLITSPGNHPESWEKLGTINFLDDKPAFEMYSNILVK